MPAFYNELRGKHLHIAKLLQNIHRVWAHLLALILWCQLLKQFWLMDGRTWKKKVSFKQKSFWFGRDQTGWIFPYFGRIFPYFRTPSGQPSVKKNAFEEKKAFACSHCVGKSSKENVSPKLGNAPVCPQLSVETYPRTCKNERAKSGQKSKPKKIETMASNTKTRTNTLDVFAPAPSISQNQNGTCNDELQVGNAAYLFWLPLLQRTSMSKHH